MASPLVSVIMATYNRSNVLPYSIGSVLDQTYANFELLVVGDGCTDDSRQVVESINDPRVRWIGLPENFGHQSIPNNTGLHEASGEIVAYLGHDDLWLPHHLQACVEAIGQGCDTAYDLSLLVAEDERSTFIGPVVLPYQPGEWLPPSSVVHKKSILDATGNWQDYRSLNCAPETELWNRMYTAGYHFRLVPRLGVVKIPGAMRKDVYVTRAQHEQQAWLQRIRSEPALEATELAKCYVSLRCLDDSQLGTTRYRKVLRFFIRETIFRIRRRISRFSFRKRHEIDRVKEYKGITTKT